MLLELSPEEYLEHSKRLKNLYVGKEKCQINGTVWYLPDFLYCSLNSVKKFGLNGLTDFCVPYPYRYLVWNLTREQFEDQFLCF